MNKTRPYRELLLESLGNSEDARHYLAAVLEDYPEGFLKAVKNVIRARDLGKGGGLSGDRSSPKVELRELADLLADLRLKLSIETISTEKLPDPAPAAWVALANENERQVDSFGPVK
jgi:hypothetical protein